MSAAALTPADLACHIAEAGIAAEILPMLTETPTVAAAAAALGVAPAQIIKTLLFFVAERPVLVIASGDAPVDRRPLAERYGVGKKQVRLADAATVLALAGYPVGGVPPFGHLTQAASSVAIPVLLDRRIAAWDAVYGGGGDEYTLVRVAPAELARVTGGEWVELA